MELLGKTGSLDMSTCNYFLEKYGLGQKTAQLPGDSEEGS